MLLLAVYVSSGSEDKFVYCNVINFKCRLKSSCANSLHPRKHDFVLPPKGDKNFIPRVLYSSLLNR